MREGDKDGVMRRERGEEGRVGTWEGKVQREGHGSWPTHTHTHKGDSATSASGKKAKQERHVLAPLNPRLLLPLTCSHTNLPPPPPPSSTHFSSLVTICVGKSPPPSPHLSPRSLFLFIYLYAIVCLSIYISVLLLCYWGRFG